MYKQQVGPEQVVPSHQIDQILWTAVDRRLQTELSDGVKFGAEQLNRNRAARSGKSRRAKAGTDVQHAVGGGPLLLNPSEIGQIHSLIGCVSLPGAVGE